MAQRRSCVSSRKGQACDRHRPGGLFQPLQCRVFPGGDWRAVEKAIDTLEHCVPQLGLQQVHWMAQDVDMNPLRDHPRYRALIERLEVGFAEADGPSESGPEGQSSAT